MALVAGSPRRSLTAAAAGSRRDVRQGPSELGFRKANGFEFDGHRGRHASDATPILVDAIVTPTRSDLPRRQPGHEPGGGKGTGYRIDGGWRFAWAMGMVRSLRRFLCQTDLEDSPSPGVAAELTRDQLPRRNRCAAVGVSNSRLLACRSRYGPGVKISTGIRPRPSPRAWGFRLHRQAEVPSARSACRSAFSARADGCQPVAPREFRAGYQSAM